MSLYDQMQAKKNKNPEWPDELVVPPLDTLQARLEWACEARNVDPAKFTPIRRTNAVRLSPLASVCHLLPVALTRRMLIGRFTLVL